MEINDKPVPSPRPAQRVGQQPAIDFTRPMREGIEKFSETFEPRVVDTAAGSRPQPREADRLELSEAARKLAAQETSDGAPAAELRNARLEELRTQLREGRLNTPERIDRAAERMLGAE